LPRRTDGAHCVAAGFARSQAAILKFAQQGWRIIEFDEVILNGLASRDVGDAIAILLTGVRQDTHLVRRDFAVLQLDTDHLVLAALALAIDAVHQPEGFELLVRIDGASV